MLSRRQKKKIISALIVLIAAAAAYFQPGVVKDGLQTASNNQPGLYEVEETSDGDTIILNMNGKREIVRLVGVDTPETVSPSRPVECYGKQASDFSRQLLTGQKVRLEADPKSTNRDRYGRLLRYVYLSDGTLVEERLISEGFGFSYTQFPFEKKAEFERKEQQAREAKKGLWGLCQISISESGMERTNPLP